MKSFKVLLIVLLINISPVFSMDAPVKAPVDPAITSADGPEQSSEEAEIEGNKGDLSENYGELSSQSGEQSQSHRKWWQFSGKASSAKAPKAITGTDIGTTSSISVGDDNKSPMTTKEAERGLNLGELNNKVFRGKSVTYDGDQVGFSDNFNNNEKKGVLKTWADRFNDYWGGGKTRKEIYALSAEAENLEYELKKTDLTKPEYDDKIKKLSSVIKQLESRRTNMRSTTQVVNDHMQTIKDRLNNWTKHTSDGLKRQIKDGVEGLRQYAQAGVDGIKAGVYTPDAETLNRLSNLARRVSTREGQSDTLAGISSGIDELKNGVTDAYGNLRDRVNQWATTDSSKKDSDWHSLIHGEADRREEQRVKEENALAATLLVEEPSSNMMNHASMKSLREAQEIADSEDNQKNADTLRDAQESRVKSSLEDLDRLRDEFMKKSRSTNPIERSENLNKHIRSGLNQTAGLDPKEEMVRLQEIQTTYEQDPPDWYTKKQKNGESLQEQINNWINSLSVSKDLGKSGPDATEERLQQVESRLRKGEYTTKQQKYDLSLLRNKLEGGLVSGERFENIQRAMDSSAYKNGTLRVDQWGDIQEQRKRLQAKVDSASGQLNFYKNNNQFKDQIDESQNILNVSQKELDDFDNRIKQESTAREKLNQERLSREKEAARKKQEEATRKQKIQEEATRTQEEYRRQQREQEEALARQQEASKQARTKKVQDFNQRFEDIKNGDYGDFETKNKALSKLKRELESFLEGNSGQLEQGEIDQVKDLLKNVTLDFLESRLATIKQDGKDEYTVAKIGSLMEQINTADASQLLKDNPKLKELYTETREYASQNGINLAGKYYLRPDWVSESDSQPAQSDSSFVQTPGMEDRYGGAKGENFKRWQENQSGYKGKQSAAEQVRIEADLNKAKQARIEASSNLLSDQLSGNKSWSEDPESQDDTVPDYDSSSLAGQSETSVGSGGKSTTDPQRDMLNQISGMSPEEVQQESLYNLDTDPERLNMEKRKQRKNTNDWNKTLGRAKKYQERGRSLDDLRGKDYYNRLTGQQKERINDLYQGYTEGTRKERGNIRNLRNLSKDVSRVRVKGGQVNF